MLLKILKMILYFFVIFAKPVYADSFDTNKDAIDNYFYHTVAFTAGDYPETDGISYKKSDFLAETTSLVMTAGISNLTDFDYRRRITNVADHIAAPPGTQVDILYFYKNSSGHDINISKIQLMLSRNNKALGDLTKILEGVENISENSVLYLYDGWNLTRSGTHEDFVKNLTIANNAEGGFILKQVKIKNPLSIDKITATRTADNNVDVEMYIQNNSEEYLNNIKVIYSSHEEIFNLDANAEQIVRFTVQTTEDVLGTIQISNPNEKQYCAVNGTSYYNYITSDAVPVYTLRGNSVMPGATVQPAVESFCIKRIPYTMTINIPEAVSEVSDTEPNVLGITSTTLPKTGTLNIWTVPLLVADGLLWYAFCRLRRKYENTNCNSRICSKSS